MSVKLMGVQNRPTKPGYLWKRQFVLQETVHGNLVGCVQDRTTRSSSSGHFETQPQSGEPIEIGRGEGEIPILTKVHLSSDPRGPLRPSQSILDG